MLQVRFKKKMAYDKCFSYAIFLFVVSSNNI